MHSLAPYLIRSFNPGLPGKPEDKYARLDRLGSHDAYKILKDFIKSKKSNFHLVDGSKQVYRFHGFQFSDSERIVRGWMQLGSYGYKSQIINVKTGNVDYNKTQENAEIINHFVYFSIPKGRNEGVALLHLFRGGGVKTIFHDMFKKYFNSVTGFNIQMNPLSYDKAFAEWENANAKEIRLMKFEGLKDVEDKLKKLGHDEKVLTLKSPRKSSLGKLKDYFDKKSEQSKAIEFLIPLCAQVKTVVELNGRKRTFSIGRNVSNSICEIDAPDDIETIGGNPTPKAMIEWCEEVADEFSQSLYS